MISDAMTARAKLLGGRDSKASLNLSMTTGFLLDVFFLDHDYQYQYISRSH